MLAATACQNTPNDSPADTPVAEAAVESGTVAPPTLPPAAVATNTPTPEPTLTPTPAEPLAALVNGEMITLADYEAELARYEQAQASLSPDTPPPDSYRTQVLDALIERELILQAAAASGVRVTDAMVDERLAELRGAAGESGSFEEWLTTNGWTADEFREALAAEMITGEIVSQVTAGVPTTAEQVRARYIQMDDQVVAQDVLTRARAGDDFAFLAQQNSVDRVTGENGGDLGFFGRGDLLVPEVEEAAFALQPGEISDLIAVSDAAGATVYYIIMVTERDPARALTADARYELLQAAFDEWLQTLWEAATIERLVEDQ